MTAPADLPPSEYWPACRAALAPDGLWQPADPDDAEAPECFLLQVYGEGGALVDAVAWKPEAPEHWWLRYGNAAYLGDAAITLGNFEGVPVELVPNPKTYLARDGRAVCVLRWDSDLESIEAAADHGFVCRNLKLADHFKNTLARQRRDAVRVEVVAA